MKIKYTKHADKKLQSLDETTRKRIEKGIEGIPKGDIKPLVGYPGEYLRLRIGGYRVIFVYEDEKTVVHVINVGSRGDIYKS